MRSFVSLLCCGLLVFSGPAFAKGKGAPKKEETEDQSEQIQQAQQLYESGKYAEAAKLLEEVNKKQPNPNVVYNIARAWDQAGELEKSLDYYQQYVASKEGTNPTLLKRAALSIDRLKGLIAKADEERKKNEEAQKKAEAETEEAKKKAEAEAEAARKAQEDADAQRQAQVETQKKTRSRNKLLAFTAGGVGIVGLGAGTVFGLQARSSKSKFDAATTVAEKQSFESQTRSQALIADVGFGVGIAAIVTAVLLYPKGPNPGEEEEQQQDNSSGGQEEESSMNILVGPNSAGLLVRF